MSKKVGMANEEIVAERYRKQGYQVLNVNKKGFPDLIVLEDNKIKLFIEVKGGKHKVHSFQQDVHKELEKMGFRVETVTV